MTEKKSKNNVYFTTLNSESAHWIRIWSLGSKKCSGSYGFGSLPLIYPYTYIYIYVYWFTCWLYAVESPRLGLVSFWKDKWSEWIVELWRILGLHQVCVISSPTHRLENQHGRPITSQITNLLLFIFVQHQPVVEWMNRLI